LGAHQHPARVLARMRPSRAAARPAPAARRCLRCLPPRPRDRRSPRWPDRCRTD
jgi:hypothetical protein